MPDDLANYITENYGKCRLDECLCRARKWWFGRRCPNWEPVTARDLDELRREQEKG